MLSLPKRLRGFLQRDAALAGKGLRIWLEEVERELRGHCPEAGGKARTGAVAFPHRFGTSLNPNDHFHAGGIDAVYGAEAEGVRFHEALELSEAALGRGQERVRRRVLKAFVRWGLLEPETRDERLEWRHGGGSSLHAAVHIEADDRQGLERLLRYGACPPLAAGHLHWRDEQHERLVYRLPKAGTDGSPEQVLTGLELLERLSAFIPPPRVHRHRYYGVLAPNALLRPAVTALASQQAAAEQAAPSSPISETQGATSRSSPPEEKLRRPSVYLWAMRLARIYEVFPLVCPRGGGEVEIISFLTEAPTVHAILTPIGEPAEAPPSSPEPQTTRLGEVRLNGRIRSPR